MTTRRSSATLVIGRPNNNSRLPTLTATAADPPHQRRLVMMAGRSPMATRARRGRCFPYASQLRAWEAGARSNVNNYLILMVPPPRLERGDPQVHNLTPWPNPRRISLILERTKRCPRHHHRPALIKGIATPISSLGLVLDHVRKRLFCQLVREFGRFPSPVAEC